MAKRNVPFKGGGEIFIRPIDLANPNQPFATFGNCDDFNFAISEEKQTQKNFQEPGGGNAASSSVISDVTGTINGLSYQADSIAIGLRAAVKTALVDNAVVEVHRLSVKGHIMLNKIVNSITTLKVFNTALATKRTLVLDTDYTISGNAIKLLAPAFVGYVVSIADPLQIECTFVSYRTHEVAALAKAALTYELYFNGFNEADKDNPFMVRCHKVQFSPTQALALINDDYGSNAVNFEVLNKNDATIISDSNYFVVSQRQDAGTDDDDS